MVNLKHEDERLTAVLEREEKDIKRLMEVINMIDRYILFDNEVYFIKKLLQERLGFSGWEELIFGNLILCLHFCLKYFKETMYPLTCILFTTVVDSSHCLQMMMHSLWISVNKFLILYKKTTMRNSR